MTEKELEGNQAEHDARLDSPEQADASQNVAAQTQQSKVDDAPVSPAGMETIRAEPELVYENSAAMSGTPVGTIDQIEKKKSKRGNRTLIIAAAAVVGVAVIAAIGWMLLGRDSTPVGGTQQASDGQPTTATASQPTTATTSQSTTGTAYRSMPGMMNQATPTRAYKTLYEAVKSKDHDGIKRVLSKGTLEMMEAYAAMQKKTLNHVVENGLTETTFAPELPESRNEKITGDFAILEVKNEKTGAWEALPFQKEDDNWKLAIDTYFKGTMSPSGPTNPEHPGELPPGAKPGAPQATPLRGKRTVS